MPPRVLASGPKPCAGKNKIQNSSVHLVILFCAMKLVGIVFLANKLWSNDNYHSLDNFAEVMETF